MDIVKRLKLRIYILEWFEIVIKCIEDLFNEIIVENYINIEKEMGI